ncbi:ABC transporter [Streptomyces sp. PsTaAH-124]|uniref:ABC transporter n=1 Tax=Streptomyces sp. PsTaAH-124 TaxID=1157638 RepID=UPI0003AA3DB1|nr:ABC transporter [Streptomyces sp. PsTaAH-124]
MREVTKGRERGADGTPRRVIGALVRPVWRALPWRVTGAAGGLALLCAGGTRLVPDGGPGPAAGVVVLRLVALLGGFALGFLLDDPARHATSAVPVRRPVRAALRLALVAPLAAAWWTAALLLVPEGARPPAGPLTLEAAATALTALALAAATVRFGPEPTPGTTVALTLLVLAVALLLAPERWSLLPAPGDPNWAVAHRWWAAIGAAAALAWAACLPDPLGGRGAAGHRGSAGLRSPSGT